MGRQRRRQQKRRREQRQVGSPAGPGDPQRVPEAPLRPAEAATRGRARLQPTGGIGGWPLLIGGLIILLVVIGLAYALASHQNAATPTVTVPTATLQSFGKPVDGIQCQASEVLVYHIHQHLDLYDRGKHLTVPADIGIPGGSSAICYYWLHVHEGDPNIIHVESPTARTYTLGNVFDIWKATRSTTQPPGDAYVLSLEAAAKRGQVTAFYNGKAWKGSYRSIPLTAHAVITMEIGKPVVPPQPFTNWQGE